MFVGLGMVVLLGVDSPVVDIHADELASSKAATRSAHPAGRGYCVFILSSWYHGICRWPIPEPPIYEIKYLCPTTRRGRVSLATMRDAHNSYPALVSPVVTFIDRRFIS